MWVVADGALQLLPFGALRDKDGKSLAERLAVAEAPSLSLALSRRGARPAPDTGAEKALGDLRGEYLPIRGMYMPVRGGTCRSGGRAGLAMR